MRTILLFVVTVLAPSGVVAQSVGGPTAIGQSFGQRSFSSTRAGILQKSAVPLWRLNEDLSTIRSESPETLQGLHEQGLDRLLALKAMTSSWELLRTGPTALSPQQPLTSQVFAKRATELADFTTRQREEIGQMRPDLPDQLLRNDQHVIMDQFPDIVASYRERGYSEEDARRGTAEAWRILRARPGALPPSVPLPATTYGKLTKSLVLLAVNSHPVSGATIKVDGIERGRTPDSVWLVPSPLPHVIEVSMPPEYPPVIRSITVADRDRPRPWILTLVKRP